MKKSSIIAIVIVAVLFVVGILLGFQLKKYLDEVPVITAENPVHADIGGTLSVDQLADVENAVDVQIARNIDFGDCDPALSGAKVSSDGKSIYVGLVSTDLKVRVVAIGANSEVREKEVTIQIFYVD